MESLQAVTEQLTITQAVTLFLLFTAFVIMGLIVKMFADGTIVSSSMMAVQQEYIITIIDAQKEHSTHLMEDFKSVSTQLLEMQEIQQDSLFKGLKLLILDDRNDTNRGIKAIIEATIKSVMKNGRNL